MCKLLAFCLTCLFSLSACEQTKQDSTTKGAVPKQIIDKTNSDIDKASEIAAERLKAAESEANSENAKK